MPGWTLASGAPRTCLSLLLPLVLLAGLLGVKGECSQRGHVVVLRGLPAARAAPVPLPPAAAGSQRRETSTV